MTHKSIHQGVEFISKIEDQGELHAWYDRLPASEVKLSITAIRCRKHRPCEQASALLVVLCQNPFSDRIHRDESCPDILNGEHYPPDSRNRIAWFAGWIESHDMPHEVQLGQQHAFVDWWPMEMVHYATSELSPQDRAKQEMDNNLLDCLELIRLTTIPDPAFLALWTESNEPFFAAGRLLYGEFLWTRDVPVDFLRCGTNMQDLLERVGSCARELVGVVRLALLADAESPILDRASTVIRRFKARYVAEIPRWENLACELIDKEDDSDLHATIADSALYEEIDGVCDRLRSDLVEVVRNLEGELVLVLNALLPTLEVPPSSVLFSDKEDDSGGCGP